MLLGLGMLARCVLYAAEESRFLTGPLARFGMTSHSGTSLRNDGARSRAEGERFAEGRLGVAIEDEGLRAQAWLDLFFNGCDHGDGDGIG
jgi:hypothetical protein